MGINPSRKIITQKRLVVKAPRRRVWDLLAKIIYQQLPMEKVDIIGFYSFKALLKLKIGFIVLPFNLEGNLAGSIAPSLYCCKITVKKGPIQLQMKVTIDLATVENNNTSVTCIATEDGVRTLYGWLLSGQERNFSNKMFESIGVRLQQICS
jgi:hypothetical protein